VNRIDQETEKEARATRAVEPFRKKKKKKKSWRWEMKADCSGIRF
jgi:hypothetical protein